MKTICFYERYLCMLHIYAYIIWNTYLRMNTSIGSKYIISKYMKVYMKVIHFFLYNNIVCTNVFFYYYYWWSVRHSEIICNLHCALPVVPNIDFIEEKKYSCKTAQTSAAASYATTSPQQLCVMAMHSDLIIYISYNNMYILDYIYILMY